MPQLLDYASCAYPLFQKYLFIMLWISVLGTIHKLAIKLVNLFKCFKSSSLFCSDCHSLHFCSMSQWQWQGQRITDFSEHWVLTFPQYACIATNTLLPVIDSIIKFVLDAMHGQALFSHRGIIAYSQYKWLTWATHTENDNILWAK